MKLIELFENKTVLPRRKSMLPNKTNFSMLESILYESSNHNIIYKSWHNLSTKKIVEVEHEHWEEINDHPEKFGLPLDYKVNRSAADGAVGAFEAVANLIKMGWVRASYEIPASGNRIMFAEGINLKDIRQVVRYYIEKFPDIEKVLIDSLKGTIQLKDNQIDQFARTGRIQRDRLGITENIETSSYGAWYDANTNKLYKLPPLPEHELSPHQEWLMKNLSLIGETKEDLRNKDEDFEYIYQKAKDYGLVRIIYPQSETSSTEYNIDGNLESIKNYLKKYYRQIIRSIKAQEIDTLYIELSEELVDTHSFHFDSWDELENIAALREFNQFVMS